MISSNAKFQLTRLRAKTFDMLMEVCHCYGLEKVEKLINILLLEGIITRETAKRLKNDIIIHDVQEHKIAGLLAKCNKALDTVINLDVS